MINRSQIVLSTQEGNRRHITQPFVIVGCLIEKDGKYLLVQQNGKWNHPCGWLELGESLVEGAKREVKEETGLEVRIINLIGVYTLIKNKSNKVLHAVKFIFRAKPKNEKSHSKKKLDYDWFSSKQISSMRGRLWDFDLIMIVNDAEKNKSIPLELIRKIIKY